MDITKYTEQFAKAFISSYAALVNTLKSPGGFDEGALMDRLTQYSDLLAEGKDVGASQFLNALVASLSGKSDGAAAIPRILH